MYKKILVPLDGSKLAEQVLAYSTELAGRLNADIALLTVCPTGFQDSSPMYAEYINSIAEKLKTTVTAKEKTEASGAAYSGTISGTSVAGYPAEEILQFAEDNAVDLIIMGTHGYSGIKRWALGSTADKVLRESRVPVLLDRAGIIPETDCQKLSEMEIIILLDGSELAESVLPHVEAICQYQTELQNVVLLRICDSPLMPAYYPPNVPQMPDEFIRTSQEGEKAVAEKYLTHIAEKMHKMGFTVTSRVLTGKPADEIIKYTDQHSCSLIVMSTHGRSGLTRWVYGSVAERVLGKSSSPILLVRPQ